MKSTLKFLMLCFGGLLLLSSFSINNVSFANRVVLEQTLPEPEKQTAQATKESFLKAWETNIKNLPTTVTFEKTEKPNIYNYETTLFPYKGELQLNNIIIDRNLGYYYDYDLGVENAIKGAAEITLLNLSNDDLYKKYPLSQQIWAKGNFLFFDDAAGRWLNAQQWQADHAVADTVYGRSNSSCDRASQILNNIFGKVWPLLLIILFLGVFILAIKKAQKEQIAKYDLSMKRQMESIEIQKEQTALLKQLVSHKDQT